MAEVARLRTFREMTSLWRAAGRPTAGFTLVEALVVAAILSLLIAVLLPSLYLVRARSRIVRVHSDLRQITTALDSYALNHRDRLPPTRSACGTRVNNQLPVELAEEKYFARDPSRIPQAAFQDFFNPAQTYKYVAPGPIYYNGALFDAPHERYRLRAKVWVPDDFPRCASASGQWYHDYADEPRSPVRYAVWSMGPDPQSVKLPRVEGGDEVDDWLLPLPRKYWLLRVGDAGLITHFRSRQGIVHQSP